MRVGTVCYATDQGIAHLAKWFYDAGVVTDVMVFRHGSRPTHMEWYPEGTKELVGRPFTDVDEWVRQLDVILFFETPFDWLFPDYCRQRGVRTALMTMYEWTPVRMPHRFDRILCPSLLDKQYYPEGVYIPVPVTVRWSLRTHAKRFLQNAGNVGCKGHKGLAEFMAAIPLVKSPAEFTVRAQDTAELSKLLRAYPLVEKDPRVTVVSGSVPYGTLFDNHDVFVAPEKFNGLSLPLQEAYASGMCVCTTNRFPTNAWLKSSAFIPVARMQRTRMGGTYNEFDECLVEPRAIAATIDRVYGTSIHVESYAGLRWAQENSWEKLKSRYLEALS